MYRTQESNGPIAIVTLGPAVVAMDRATGTRLWMHQAGRFVAYDRLTVTADRVYVAGNHTVTCLVYTTGALVYSIESPVFVKTWLFDGGQILVAGSGEVACLDAASGRVVWHDRFEGFGHYASALGVPGVSVPVDNA